MHSDRFARSRVSGFTLFEAMVALAVLGLVMTASLKATAYMAARQAEAFQDHAMVSFARAILDEYIVTGELMKRSGTYKDTWQWQITETGFQPTVSTDYDQNFSFIEITVLVSKLDQPTRPAKLSTIVARRASGS